MHFCHASEIWKDFPQLVARLMVLDGIHPAVDVEKRLQPWYEKARERLGQGPESQMPEIAAWRQAY